MSVTLVVSKGMIVIVVGYTSKLNIFDILKVTSASNIDGFSNSTAHVTNFPSSAFNNGSLTIGFSSACKCSSYQISPSFSLMKAIEPTDLN